MASPRKVNEEGDDLCLLLVAFVADTVPKTPHNRTNLLLVVDSLDYKGFSGCSNSTGRVIKLYLYIFRRKTNYSFRRKPTMKITALLLVACGVDSFFIPAPVFHRHHGANTLQDLASSRAHFRPAVASLSMSSGTLISTNEELLPGIEAIDAANDDLFVKLDSLRDEPYFRLYSVDILASCEYMPQELFECYSESCEIYPVEEEEVSLVPAHHFISWALTGPTSDAD